MTQQIPKWEDWESGAIQLAARIRATDNAEEYHLVIEELKSLISKTIQEARLELLEEIEKVITYDSSSTAKRVGDLISKLKE